LEGNEKDDPFIHSDDESDDDDKYEQKDVNARPGENINKNRTYLDYGLEDGDDV